MSTEVNTKPTVMRHPAETPAVTPSGAEPQNAPESSDLDPSFATSGQNPHMIHSASYKTLHNKDLRNIIRKRKPQNKWIPAFTEQQRQEFWAMVDQRGPDECWLWKGVGHPAHKYSPHILYGVWKTFKAHRVAYRIAIGKIPDGLTVDHVKARGCTSTLCCNPAHLEAVSQTEQVERRDADKMVAPGFTTCKYGHVRPRGRKAHCPECNKMHAARFRARHADRIKNYPSRQPKKAELHRAQIDALAFNPSTAREPGLEVF